MRRDPRFGDGEAEGLSPDHRVDPKASIPSGAAAARPPVRSLESLPGEFVRGGPAADARIGPASFPRTSSHAGGHSWACGSSACAAASGEGRVGRGAHGVEPAANGCSAYRAGVHPGPAQPRQPCRPGAIRATNARDGQAQGPRPHILHPNPTPSAARTPPEAASPMPQPVSKLSAKRPASARLLRSTSKPFSKRGPALQQLQRDIGTVR